MTHIELEGQPPIALPENLLSNIRMVHGAPKVDAWLEQLPAMLEGLLAELNARIVAGEPPLSYHLVFFAERSDGEEIVVKCTVPSDEQPPELAAVHALSDAGIGPRLLWSDLDRGVLVMERVQPGTTMPTALPTLAEDALIARDVATLASHMARDADLDAWIGDLVPVRRYSQAISEVDPGSELWKRHRPEIERALDLREALLDAPDRRDVFLHGDLHHYNVLGNTAAGWRVIDPKGLVGPPGYEFGAFTYNPVGIQHHPDIAGIERQRVRIWSEVTGLPWETVRSWGYVAAVLSACWSGEGGVVEWQHAMTIAETLRDLSPPG